MKQFQKRKLIETDMSKLRSQWIETSKLIDKLLYKGALLESPEIQALENNLLEMIHEYTCLDRVLLSLGGKLQPDIDGVRRSVTASQREDEPLLKKAKRREREEELLTEYLDKRKGLQNSDWITVTEEWIRAKEAIVVK